jgi:MSHA biogenesis protein MshP
MRPERLQRGFALPAAIFLLVVLGGLAAWLMRSTEMGTAQDALELEGERAYQAAQAGLEAGIYAARQPGNTCAQVTQNIAFSGNLAGFAASVTCTVQNYDEGGTAVTLYTVTSVACNQPAGGTCPNSAPSLPEYAERHVQAVVEGG